MADPQEEPEFPSRTTVGGAGIPPLPGSPVGVGGNSTLTNQNEREISEASWENPPCEYTGYQDDARRGA